jgi:hypothetical protein
MHHWAQGLGFLARCFTHLPSRVERHEFRFGVSASATFTGLINSVIATKSVNVGPDRGRRAGRNSRRMRWIETQSLAVGRPVWKWTAPMSKDNIKVGLKGIPFDDIRVKWVSCRQDRRVFRLQMEETTWRYGGQLWVCWIGLWVGVGINSPSP